MSQIIEEVQTYITSTLEIVTKSEIDLRWYVWTEENGDVSKTENSHLGEILYDSLMNFQNVSVIQ